MYLDSKILKVKKDIQSSKLLKAVLNKIFWIYLKYIDRVIILKIDHLVRILLIRRLKLRRARKLKWILWFLNLRYVVCHHLSVRSALLLAIEVISVKTNIDNSSLILTFNFIFLIF